MQPVEFKSSLFGFKRKQVLGYINSIYADFEQQMQAVESQHEDAMQSLREDYENKLRTHEHALSVQLEENRHLEEELTGVAASLEEKFVLLKEEQKKTDDLHAQLKEKQLQNEALNGKLIMSKQAEDIANGEIRQLKERLAAKDSFIADQTLEVTRLRDHVAKLEEEFSALREDTNQSTAMVNCLNLLHGRNRALSQKVARLEAQLDDIRTGSEVKQYAKTVGEKQETIKTTENLFATVRKEIQDALDSISHKIEEGSIEESDDGNYFVDMANL